MTQSKADIDQKIQQRHDQVVGKPTRLPPVDKEAVFPEVRDATTRLRTDLFGDPNPLPFEQTPEIMFTMHPFGALWERIMAMSMQLVGPDSKVPRREQKLLIIRTGWLLMAPYEFGEHVSQSHQLGLNEEEIEAIVTNGSADPRWTEQEAAILKLAEELRADAMCSDETWDILAKYYSIEQLFELLVIAGHFTTIGYFQNGLRVPLEKGNAGLTTR